MKKILVTLLLIGGFVLSAAGAIKTPSPLPYFAAGEFGSFFIIEDETLLAWGDNQYGNVGVNDASADNPHVLLEKAVFVTANQWTTLAIDENKDLWGWGFSLYGQVSLKNEETAELKQKILNDVVMAALGERHAIALKSDGSVWTWGMNTSGQMGTGEQDVANQLITHHPVCVMEGALFVAASADCSYALTEQGDLYGWGALEGDGPQLSPKLISSKIKSVAVEKDRLLIVPENSDLMAASLAGQYLSPYSIMGDIAYCGAGFAVTNDKKLLVWDSYSDSIPRKVLSVKIDGEIVSVSQNANWIFPVLENGAVFQIDRDSIRGKLLSAGSREVEAELFYNPQQGVGVSVKTILLVCGGLSFIAAVCLIANLRRRA